jgi:Cu/Ag efflux protein CusF
MHPAFAAGGPAPDGRTIMFVCLHGSVKEMLQGVVRALDERNDRIRVRLTSDRTGDFRVQDGLIFNAVRGGDRVELTVENIDGTRTIVGLKKE